MNDEEEKIFLLLPVQRIGIKQNALCFAHRFEKKAVKDRLILRSRALQSYAPHEARTERCNRCGAP